MTASNNTPSSLADAWAATRPASVKAGGFIYTRYVNRNLARPATVLFWRIGFSPNAVSLLSFGVTCLGLLILVTQTEPLNVGQAVLVWLILVVGYALDSADGQLARITFRASLSGELLDHALDSVKLILANFALAGYLLRVNALSVDLFLGVAAVGTVAHSSHFFVTLFRSRVAPEAIPSIGEEGGSGGRRAVLQLADYGFFIALVILSPLPTVLGGAYVAFTGYMFAFFVAHLVRTLRHL